MDESALKLIFVVLGVLLSFLSGFSLLMVKQASQTLKELQRANQELATKAAVADERHTSFTATIAALTQSTHELTKDVGKLSSSVQRMWVILEDAKLASKRKLTAQDG